MKHDPITNAARLLREAAAEYAEGVSINGAPDWANEPDTHAAYLEHMAAAAALESMLPGQCLHQISEPATQAAPAAVAVPDKRAAFERFQCDVVGRDLQELSMHQNGDYEDDSVQAEWLSWNARAALAAAPAHPAEGVPEAASSRDDFAWLVVQEACETEPADEDDPECIRILRRDLKSAVLAAFMRAEAAQGTGVPAPAPTRDDDHVAVPRDLLGAACSAIARHSSEPPKVLHELRRYTTGDLSAAVAAPAPVVLPELGEIDTTAPERIYLVVNPVGNPNDRAGRFDNCAEVSWCATSQGGVEVAYVRADLAMLAGVSAPAAQAVASIYVTADGQRECDDWKMPLPIGRNLLYTAPQAQADARDAAPAVPINLDVLPMPKNPHDAANEPAKHVAWAAGAGAVFEVVHTALAAAPAASVLDALIEQIRALPTLKAPELDGEESDGTPKHWRSRPFVSLTKLERILRAHFSSAKKKAGAV